MKFQLKMLILAGALSASAAPALAGSAYTVTADFPYVTNYVFRGVEYARHSVQPSVTLAMGSFSAGVWSNQPIIDLTADEVDFFAGYDFGLSKDWKINVGATLYWYPELDTSTGADSTTIEPKLSLTGPLGPVTSTLTIYYDTTLETSTMEGSLGYSLPMHGSDKDTVDFAAAYGHVAPDIGGDYSYWSASAKATFRPKDNLSVYFGLVYASTDLPGQRNHVYGLAGISYSFSRG